MIYTDGIHLVATTLKELHCFAEKCNIKKCYYEGYRKGHPHYDLINPQIKNTAIKNGAKLTSAKDIVRMFKNGEIQSKHSDPKFK